MSLACKELPVLPALRTDAPCDVFAAIKKRNGQPLYWCHTHGEEVRVVGDIVPANCRGAASSPVSERDVFVLDIDRYPGGVAAWGGTPPVIARGCFPAEPQGVHVHVREAADGAKVIDQSFAVVRVVSGNEHVDIDDESARAFMLSSVAGEEPSVLTCPKCGWSHLDRDVFAVRPHRKHLCNRCGRNFWARELTVANPVVDVRRLDGVGPPGATVPATGRLVVRSADYAGVAIWASNPAILWTFDKPEADGIHVHAWDRSGRLAVDDTYARVTLDGEDVDPTHLRLLMAQLVLLAPSRVVTLRCPTCDRVHADIDANAFRPSSRKECLWCGCAFRTPGHRLLVSNPLRSQP